LGIDLQSQLLTRKIQNTVKGETHNRSRSLLC
jgi:hypothetical protein